jgi:hypothetical protein
VGLREEGMRSHARSLVPPARFAIVCACVLTAWSVAYALLRVVERVTLPQPNPAMISWSERSAFSWRLVLAGYVALAIAPLAWTLARRSSLARAAPLWLVGVALASVAQAWLAP